MTLRMPVPKLQQRRPKRRRPTTWLLPTVLSQPMISSSLRQHSRSQLAGVPTTTTVATIRTRATASLCSRRKSPHQSCLSIRSLNVPAMAIYGRQDIGAMLRRATTGFLVLGPNRPKWATFGLPDIGDFTVAGIVITTARGVSMLATTAASTMDSATEAPATRAGTGAEGASTITAASTI
jgi:hypothetical protein